MAAISVPNMPMFYHFLLKSLKTTEIAGLSFATQRYRCKKTGNRALRNDGRVYHFATHSAKMCKMIQKTCSKPSFRRKPESSREGFAPPLWIPASAGMTKKTNMSTDCPACHSSWTVDCFSLKKCENGVGSEMGAP